MKIGLILKNKLRKYPIEDHKYYYLDIIENQELWVGFSKTDITYITNELNRLFPELMI